MPEMTGTELCKRLKTDAETPYPGNHTLTAQSDLGTPHRGTGNGVPIRISPSLQREAPNVRIEKLIVSYGRP